MMTTEQAAARFHELAAAEKWFEIQDELFAADVRSVEPAHSRWFRNAEGKQQVRKKGEEFVSKVTAFHSASTTKPVVGDNHFAVGREVDITTADFGRIQIRQVMLYEVKDGQIVLEQFHY